MGGGFYDGDVGDRQRSSCRDNFTYSGYEGPDEDAATARRAVHDDLNIKDMIRECRDTEEHPQATPIIVAMDVTRSRGDDAKVIYGKLPMFIGQLIMKGYVDDPEICFAAVGDATSGDKAPIQVAQFDADNVLDEHLGKIWLEEGGGGTGQESYELMAYYLARKTELDCWKRGKKGYLFFLGDEGFYSNISKDQIKTYIGDDVPSDIPTEQIFRELQEKYHVFFVYPQKTWEERKDDIDAEIKKRLDEAGGQYEDIDFRATGMWNTYDDLDLHVIVDPDVGAGGVAEHIAYDNKVSRNGRGELDVDRNAGGRETRKPVENVRWERGSAPKGKYTVFMRNFSVHDDNSYRQFPIDFTVEVEMHGKIQTFTDTIGQGTVGRGSGTPPTGSDVVVGTFDFDPNERPLEVGMYSGYDDQVIKAQWASVIPEENILIIDDPRAVVDVMMGALAISEGTDIDDYIVDMAGRGQTQIRQSDARGALDSLASTTAIAKVDTGNLPARNSGKRRKNKTSRL
ncbi:MAG: hypothetical protein ACKUBY_01955 [Candidatus Moraniibacteriota bacterium]|jgi:hypothetical protein